MKKRACVLIGVALAYGLTGGLLYRQRVMGPRNFFWDSDVCIFAAPMLLALIVIAWVLWPPASQGSLLMSKVKALGLAAFSTIITFWVYTSVVFSLYGT